MTSGDQHRQPVVVVTGGGGGIGGAIATELGRQGWFVVTVDPLVDVEGVAQAATSGPTTADRIVAAGGSARASSASVTDGLAIDTLFRQLAAEHGRLDAVINVAGFTRLSNFVEGTEQDWRSLLEVHLTGWLNVLSAALPVMAAAGHGRILGVTSGSGWRPADAGAYACAKRAVAALTWQLGAHAPEGVTVNAMSPIAATRMVEAALERAMAMQASQTGNTPRGGLSLTSMPQPEDLGPSTAYLVGDSTSWCNGQVVFVGGGELAVVDPPRLLEVVRTEGVTSVAGLLDVVVPKAFAKAEERQASTGGANPRFAGAFDADGELDAPTIGSCAVVTDQAAVGEALRAALDARGVDCVTLDTVAGDFAGAAATLDALAREHPSIDVVIVARGGSVAPASADTPWQQILAEHAGLVDELHADAAWSRAVAERAAAANRPMRLVTLVDATSAGGRSRAQAASQLARSAQPATGGQVGSFVIALETDEADAASPASELAAHLVSHPDALALSGAELVVGGGWIGLRAHPRLAGAITFGGPEVPDWLDATLRQLVGGPPA